MSTTRTHRAQRQDAIAAALDELELVTRVDPLDPIPSSVFDHLPTPLDDRVSTRVGTAARYGFLSTEELLEDIAAGMGRDVDDDHEERYER